MSDQFPFDTPKELEEYQIKHDLFPVLDRLFIGYLTKLDLLGQVKNLSGGQYLVNREVFLSVRAKILSINEQEREAETGNAA